VDFLLIWLLVLLLYYDSQFLINSQQLYAEVVSAMTELTLVFSG